MAKRSSAEYGSAGSSSYSAQRLVYERFPRMRHVEWTTERKAEWRKCRRDPDLLWNAVYEFQAGHEGAADALAFVMFPAIVSVVRRYRAKGWANYNDCVQEGIVAVFEGAARYELARDASPFTYLFGYIRGGVGRFLANAGEVVRVPVHRFKSNVGRQYSVVFSEMQFHWKDDPSTAFEEMIADAGDPADVALDEHLIEQTTPLMARWLLSKVPKVNAAMMLEHAGGKTLQEIGDAFGLSRERVRQLIEQGLAKCRAIADDRLHAVVGEYPTYSGWVADACEGFLHMTGEQADQPLTLEEAVIFRDAQRLAAKRRIEFAEAALKKAQYNRARVKKRKQRMAEQTRLVERFPPISDEDAAAGVRYKPDGRKIARRQ